MNSRQIFAKINELKAKQAEAIADSKTDDAMKIQGEIDAYNAMLGDALEAEAKINSPKPVASDKPKTLGEQLFGARDSFKGISEGWEGTVRAAVTGLSTPETTDTDLASAAMKPTGFIATLMESATNASETYYEEPAFTNNAAGWASGNKPESALDFPEATANLETVAHWIPVKKQMANRFSELEDAVADSLLVGLAMKNDYLALRGNNSNGIVGIVNNSHIQTYTYTSSEKSAGVNIKDVIGRMATKVRVMTGLPATHVALSPAAIQALREAKDDNGQYLFPDIDNGRIDGLTIVEDINMQVVTTSEGSTTVTETCLVYNDRSARVKVADGQEITVGYANSQFIQNEKTLLAENTWLLKVPRPKGFCYCADLLITDSESFQ